MAGTLNAQSSAATPTMVAATSNSMNEMHQQKSREKKKQHNANETEKKLLENKANDMRPVMTAWATALFYSIDRNYSDYISQVQNCTENGDEDRMRAIQSYCFFSHSCPCILETSPPPIPCAIKNAKKYARR